MDFEIKNGEIEGPNYKASLTTTCFCPKCHWKGNFSGCKIEMDSEGWEYPEYEVYVCPICWEPVEI